MKILTGNNLKQAVDKTKELQKRNIYKYLQRYLRDDDYSYEKVFILFGLYSTGKTTLMMQAIAEMPEKDIMRSAFIIANSSDRMSANDNNGLLQVLSSLKEQGYKYIFIDQITAIPNFIDCSGPLADIYASIGMKIILSGDESLSFELAVRSSLYDRAYVLHTTYIPRNEWLSLMHIDVQIDEWHHDTVYLINGGTLYNTKQKYYEDLTDSYVFPPEEAIKYIEKAIIANIYRSLANCSARHSLPFLAELCSYKDYASIIKDIYSAIEVNYCDIFLNTVGIHHFYEFSKLPIWVNEYIYMQSCKNFKPFINTLLCSIDFVTPYYFHPECVEPEILPIQPGLSLTYLDAFLVPFSRFTRRCSGYTPFYRPYFLNYPILKEPIRKRMKQIDEIYKEPSKIYQSL